MNAVVIPPQQTSSSDQDSIRQWIAELTDFTPQQIEVALSQMEPSVEAQGSSGLNASKN